MRITALTAYPQRVGNRPRILVKIDTDEQIAGWGEVYNHGPDLAFPPLLDYLFEQINGMDPRRVEYVVRFLQQSARFPPGALGLAAISAIDHALWDIAAKAAEVPVYRLLGGNVRDRVAVYCGLYNAPDVGELRDRAAGLHERYGFTAFKLSPYRIDIHRERWGRVCQAAADYFAQVRKHTPAEWDFAFDAHACIDEPGRAVRLANALADYDPLFFEEPIRPEHFPAWARVRADSRARLATGECLYSPAEFLSLLNVAGTDLIQPDIAVVGGLTQMRRIAAVAEVHEVAVAPHNPMGPLATAANLHFAAATTNFDILEYKLDETSWCPDPYLPVDGHLELRPDRPGWGVTIDEDALRGDDYLHWERRVPVRPDGSTAYM